MFINSTAINGFYTCKHEEDIPAWKKIGFSLGLAFQIQDDILDIELTAKEFGKSNSDQKNHKGTSVSILGIERAKEMMNNLYQSVIEQIKSYMDLILQNYWNMFIKSRNVVSRRYIL